MTLQGGSPSVLDEIEVSEAERYCGCSLSLLTCRPIVSKSGSLVGLQEMLALCMPMQIFCVHSHWKWL